MDKVISDGLMHQLNLAPFIRAYSKKTLVFGDKEGLPRKQRPVWIVQHKKY
jgi:hypothetical protein